MKKVLLPVILVVAILSVGCSTISKGYSIDATIQLISAGEIAKPNNISTEGTERNKLLRDLERPNGVKAQPQPTLDEIAEKTDNSDTKIDGKQYLCEITVKEITYDGDEKTEKTIASPKLIFKDGQKATITVGDDKGENGVSAEVVVNDEKNDGISKIDVHVKEKGKTLTHSNFKIKLK